MGSVFLKALFAFGTKMLMSIGTQELIEWAFFTLAEQVTKHTATPLDDEGLAKIKEIYNKNK